MICGVSGMMSEENVKKYLSSKTIDEFNAVDALVFKGRKEIAIAEYPDEVQKHLAALYQKEIDANGGIIGDPHDVFREKIK